MQPLLRALRLRARSQPWLHGGDPRVISMRRFPVIHHDQTATTSASLSTREWNPYVAETSPGLLVRRTCADDHELGRRGIPGTKVLDILLFNSGGCYLAARYADKTVRGWEVSTARVAVALPGRPSPMVANTVTHGFDLAFRPDGRQLAVARCTKAAGVGQVAFHPQRLILVGKGSNERVRFWDATSGRLFMELDSMNNRPVLAFDPSGRRFLLLTTPSHNAPRLRNSGPLLFTRTYRVRAAFKSQYRQ